MEVYAGVEIYLHSFLTLALDQGEWSTSHPDGITFWRKCPQNPCKRRVGQPIAGVGTLEKRNISSVLGIPKYFLMLNLQPIHHNEQQNIHSLVCGFVCLAYSHITVSGQNPTEF